jgi:hypothetical protein
MPVSVNVSVDAKKTLAQLNRIQKSQWPFALALALTNTAKDGQVAVQLQSRLSFNLRSEFITRGIRIKPAQKSDIVRFGLAISDVHTAERISTFMPVHEPGGTRLPVARGRGQDKGRSIAYPGKDLPSSYRTGRGAIKERWKPANLLKGYRTGARGKSQGKQIRVGKKSQGRAFIIRTGKGTPLIVRRRGGGRELERLYVLFPEAKIKPRWKFEDSVIRAVRRDFPGRLEQAMKIALKG